MVVETDRLIEITDMPPVEGLAFRRFRGESDYPLMVGILQGCKDADGIERIDSVEEVARVYSHLVNCDPYEDMIFAEVDGEAIGYGRCFWQQEIDGPRVYIAIGWVLPAWRRRGIGGAMYRWQENHLRQIAATHPAGDEKIFQSESADTQVGQQALLRAMGYAPVTYGALMRRPTLDDIPEAALPEGIEVRPVKEEHLRAIWEAEVEAFRDHWGAPELTEENYQDFLTFPYNDLSLWRVAWDGDQVVGQVRSFINPDENAEYGCKRGWTENISVRRPWRRRGVARALLVMSLHAVRERGMEEAMLGVHTENPNGAFQLYQSVGFEVVQTFTMFRKPLD